MFSSCFGKKKQNSIEKIDEEAQTNETEFNQVSSPAKNYAFIPSAPQEMTDEENKQERDPDLSDRDDQKELLNFQQECLNVHNKYREKHNVKPLALNMKMCNLAQEWTDYMAESTMVELRKNIHYGYNLFIASGTAYTVESIIKLWYDEIENYNFAKPGINDETRHFTQVIWKDTKFLGVGLKKLNRHTWVLCVYDPPGNKIGAFCDNVLAPVQNRIDDDFDDDFDDNDVDNANLAEQELQMKNSEFAKACLDVHNKYRAKHGCPPLRLNDSMNEYAIEWAKQLSKFGSLRHRPNNKYGENLFLAANYNPTAEEVIEEWYDESQLYDFKRPGFAKETGNFTQMIWKDSRELGVGLIKVGTATYVVCNYSPHGNILERFRENVPCPVLVEDLTDSSSDQSLPGKYNMDYRAPHEADIKNITFEEQCLNSHNKYRALHGCPPLSLDKRMCAYAHEWSEHLAKTSSLVHRPNSPYGENLFYATFSVTGEDPVQKWYSEINDYDFKKPGFHPSTGHFTQVVWKKTKFLGVGITKVNKVTFVVCNYEPWGNVVNHFQQNVPPLVNGNPLDNVLVRQSNATKENNYNINSPSTVEVRYLSTSNSQHNAKNQRKSTTPVASIAQTFEEQCLRGHNKYRALHGCPPLKITKVLNIYAMEWAKHLSKNRQFEHRPNGRYGENLYFGSGFRVSGSDPVTTWYNEINDYNFLKPGFSPITGHFSQLIWKNSRELGVAVVNLGDSTYVVCNYSPPGNVVGQFEENVPAALRGPFSLTELKKRGFTNQLNPEKYAEEILKLHNSYRAKHNVPQLSRTESLNRLAMEWAEHLADSNTLQHRQPPKYGENIFKATGWNITPDELMRMWYNEINSYDFEHAVFVPSAGHFTQLIWKATKVIGVGITKRDKSMWIVVNYDPPGNYEGEFKINVLPPVHK